METPNIINEVIPARNVKTRENIRKTIPLLVHWAKSQRSGTYKEVINNLGLPKYSGVGVMLADLHKVMQQFEQVTGLEIPTLNSLVKDKKTGIPSDGFDYVYPNYNNLTIPEKQIFVNGLDNKAFDYPNWDWVLGEFGLKPYVACSEEYIEKTRKSISKGQYGKGGEGAEHKALKEFVANNPKSVGVHNVVQAIEEHTLLSADRIDVLFVLKNGAKIAVEVKPSTSPEEDIARGIFQCVKYEAIMNAESKVDASFGNNSTLLVIAGTMSEQNKQIAQVLNIKYIENFRISK